eukprot:TRINITY_DN884_c0_g1_i1.p1 TRINITY_DN884_c0_g1~~TRINITY_DN884_c0_g1_i1.p1  ORF type:complete len:790 (-),score=140.85 TRINITY_DN884_c0_g1_i1:55-2388(-)
MTSLTLPLAKGTLFLLLLCAVAVSATDLCPEVQVSTSVVDAPLLGDPFWVAPSKDDGRSSWTLLALTKAYSLYKSSDQGRSWSQVSLPGIKGDIREVKLSSDSKLVVVVGAGGLYWTSNDGAATFVVREFDQSIIDIKFHPRASAWMLALISDVSNLRGELHYSSDGGENWHYMAADINKFDFHGSSAVDLGLIVASQGVGSLVNIIRFTNVFRDDPEIVFENVYSFLIKKKQLYVTSIMDGEMTISTSRDAGASFHPLEVPQEFVHGNTYTILEGNNDLVTFVGVANSRGYGFGGNVFSADSFADSLSLNLLNVEFDHAARGGKAHWSFVPVSGLDGIRFANVIEGEEGMQPNEIKVLTMISFDDGGKWEEIPLDTTQCGTEPSCRLNIDMETLETKFEAIGVLAASGSIGYGLTPTDSNLHPFISRDAGWTWTEVPNITGKNIFEIANRGALMIMADIADPTDTFHYTLDEGTEWNSCAFGELDATEALTVTNIVSDPDMSTKTFLVYGTKGINSGVIYSIQFDGIHENNCVGFDDPTKEGSDYEYFEPRDRIGGNSCLLGHETRYTRRKATSKCWNNADIVKDTDHIVIRNCSCTDEDYECDYCYARSHGGECVQDINDVCTPHLTEPYPCPMGTSWAKTRGYRLVPGTTCTPEGGLDLTPVMTPCHDVGPISGSSGPAVTPPATEGGSGGGVVVFVLILILVIAVVFGLYFGSGRYESVRNLLSVCIPESVLPQFQVRNAQYATLGVGFDDDDDLRHGAETLELDLGSSSESV